MRAADEGGWGPGDIALYVVALLAACAVVVGGVLVVKDRQDGDVPSLSSSSDGSAAAAGDADYRAVIDAAAATATALVNIDYRTPQDSLDAVAATSTGTFLDQYNASTSSLVDLVKQYKSVMAGQVVQAAVSSLDPGKATVLVATKGTVTNVDSGGDPQVRNFRIVVRLVQQDGRWLTNDLESAG